MAAPNVFISATSADLGSTRQVVKDALLTIGCHPVEQTNFPPDWRIVTQMLREKIEDCQGIIHIAGLHYGVEPDPATLPPGTARRSYTQLEYDIACELQRERGDHFQVYRFICADDFPYQVVTSPQSEEQRALQEAHRARLLEGAALYEQPDDLEVLEIRVLALRVNLEKLVGINAEAIAAQLSREIHTRFEQDKRAALEVGAKWPEVRELERRRDAALANVDSVVRTIAEGLAGNPVPIFTEATRILEQEGVDAAIAYLKSNETNQLARAERAAAQVEAAQEALEGELRPLLLQAELHETRLEWDKALALLEKVAATAPQRYDVRLGLGTLLYKLARYAEAEPHLRAAVTLARIPDEEATALNNLATLLQDTNRLDEAELLMRRALAIDETSYGPDHSNVARDLNNLAQLLKATNRLDEAEPLMRLALAIDEASYGPNHPDVAATLNNLARLFQDTNRLEEAELLMCRVIEIFEISYGPEHPNFATSLNNLAGLFQDTNRLEEAEPLMRRALAIDEASYGPDHPRVAIRLSNLAQLLQATNRLDEAEPLMRRALAIDEASYGPDHLDVSIRLNNLASLLYATNRLDEAEPLMRGMVEIFILFTIRTGHEHPHLKTAFANYAYLLKAMGFDESEQKEKIQSLIESAKNHPTD